GIDVLVNNAGYGGHAALEQSSDASVRAMFDTNVFGVFNTTRAVMPIMRKQGGGVVINVTSMAGMIGIPLETSYCASKWAVEGFTEALAMECRDLNIRVHSVLPGAYATAFNGNVQDNLEAGDAQVVEMAQRIRVHFGAIVADHHGGEQTADPQEVADMIYRCATEDMPVHNPCGSDAEMLVGLSQSPGRQPFYDNLTGLLLPPRQA
ncbi:MAG: SDR family NAD(P)-dependent oxidoreductase, partial [Gammaproteobacteria bacterium]|nr:SDR family NAD(P)-dependent oxidoreductase [Gammaproteobacteria bacterium]